MAPAARRGWREEARMARAVQATASAQARAPAGSAAPKRSCCTAGLALRRRACDISSARSSGGQLTVMQADASSASRPLSTWNWATLRPAAEKSRQICLRTAPSASRGQTKVRREVPRRWLSAWVRSTPARRRNKSKKRMSTSVTERNRTADTRARDNHAAKAAHDDTRADLRWRQAAVLADLVGRPGALRVGHTAPCMTGCGRWVLCLRPVRQ
ncbi:Uncharacterised protein [Bordetella pertussis]|nr:Uncharacterised protein [Bordetella pertussis]